MDLPSSRFFQHAERLRLRGGAVTAALASDSDLGRDRGEVTPPPPPSSPSAIAEGTADDIAALAAMSQTPGFPSIGYSGG